jgi:CHAT domain-containing protein/tetratricopeptide (TPR) repeat protein
MPLRPILLALAGSLVLCAGARAECVDTGARLSHGSIARKKPSACGDAATLFVGDQLQIPSGSSLHFTAPTPDKSDVLDVICANDSAAAVTLQVASGPVAQLLAGSAPYPCAQYPQHPVARVAEQASQKPTDAVPVRLDKVVAAAPFSDPRYQQWARDFLAAQLDAVIRATEADLVSRSPHPFAARVWARAHWAKGDLAEAGAHVANPAVRRALGDLPRLGLLYWSGRYRDALDEFPPSRVAAIDDPEALWLFVALADGYERPDLEIAPLERILRAEPTRFAFAQQVLARSGYEPFRTSFRDLLAREPGLCAAPAGRLLGTILALRPFDDLEALKAVETWLRDAHDDGEAMSYRAGLLNGRERWADMADAWTRSRQLNPFERDRFDDLGKALLRAGRRAEARELAARHGRIYGRTPDAVARRTETAFAAYLVEAGERGEAREALEHALARWPNDETLLEKMVAFEQTDSRAAFALLRARHLVQLAPNNLGYRIALIDALVQAGNRGEAEAAFDAAERELTQTSVTLYQRQIDALIADKKTTQALAVAERGTKEFPRSDWMIRVLAYTQAADGRLKEALATLRRSFDLYAPFEWSLGRMRDWMKDNDADFDKELASLRDRFPWDKPIWTAMVGRISEGDSIDKRLVLWARARAMNPGKEWPYGETVALLLDKERDDEAAKVADDALAAATQLGTAGDLADASWDGANVLGTQLRRKKLSPAQLDRLDAALGAYRDRGGYLVTYHQQRAWLFMARKQQDKAGAELLAALAIRPDSSSLLSDLFETNLDRAKRFGAIHRGLMRDPYDGRRLGQAAHRHIMWGGSDIVGLRLLELMKQNTPDTYKEFAWNESKAYSHLGDPSDDWERMANDTNVSSSERYVAWYHGARRLAQEYHPCVAAHKEHPCVTTEFKKGSRYPLSFEPGEMRVRIVHPDGRVEMREDHPVTGNPIHRENGNAWMEAAYDDKSYELNKINSSSGEFISLGHDDREHITSLTSSVHGVLHFTYGDNEKLLRISHDKLGDIVFTSDGGIAPMGDGRRAAALEILQAVSSLDSMAKGISGQGPLIEFPHEDKKLKELTTRLDKATAPKKELDQARAALELARYLVDHVRETRSHADEAKRALRLVLDGARGAGASKAQVEEGARAVGLWHALLAKLRPDGLPTDEFVETSQLDEWLQERSAADGDPTVRKEAREITRTPPKLLPLSRWLPSSYLGLDGFWRRYPFRELQANASAAPHMTAVLVRKNHDVVVGTDGGLLVQSRGFWTWYGLDEGATRWSHSLAAADLRAGSEVHALAEDAGGGLWIGTSAGLVYLAGGYEDEAKRWQSSEAGLPAVRVDHLVALEDGVLAGGAAGLSRFHAAGAQPLPRGVPSEKVEFLAAGGSDAKAPAALIGTASGLYALTGGEAVKIAAPCSSAVWSPRVETVTWLQGGVLWALPWGKRGRPGAAQRLPGQQDIFKDKQVNGLALVPLDDGTPAVAALTDLGLSVYRDYHFEHVAVRDSDKPAGVTSLSSQGARAYLLTTVGLVGLERGQAMGDRRGRVSDLLSLNDLRITLVARGESMEAVFQDHPEEGAVELASIRADFLARDPDGGVIANDGNRIVRFSLLGDVTRVGFRTPAQLFDATPSHENSLLEKHVTSLLAASDRSVWATAGASVFRWKAGKVEEFSIYKDDRRFPARSSTISRVIETVDGRIWVIASNEGHLADDGMVMTGGVLQWTGSGFEVLPLSRESDHWFIHSYTRIDNDTAIVGTGYGFARHHGARFQSFAGDLNDPSYRQLRDGHPSLFLGSRGARIGDDTWLFGTPSGLVALRDGHWFSPTRINWMLPDPFVKGSRYVHAVAVDGRGRIYAGTDRGLLIYEGGGSSQSFLLNNTEKDAQQTLFLSSSLKTLRAEADAALASVKPDSPLGKKVKAYQDGRREIERLTQELSGGARLPPMLHKEDVVAVRGESNAPRVPSMTDEQREQLRRLLEERSRRQRELLRDLEESNRSLYQMLELKPMDLIALRGRLQPGQVIVQYIPTDEKLFIQTVTHEGWQLREVKVKGAELDQHVAAAVQALSWRPPDGAPQTKPPDPTDDLYWLYNQLLFPVEQDLAGAQQVFVMPVASLTWLPFGALVKSRGDRPTYAVESYNFGYLTSLYLFDLAFSLKEQEAATEPVVFGDPDGSLPGARVEAVAVREALHGKMEPQLGPLASYDNLFKYAPSANVLHLATHAGRHKGPMLSYLVLAGGQKLDYADASRLRLDHTGLVTLSACETGRGVSGFEYATLARAFTQAGAPAVAATLWKVEDQTAPFLMRSFYRNLGKKQDRFTAISNAQREMLKGDERYRAPRQWAAYIVFGKP